MVFNRAGYDGVLGVVSYIIVTSSKYLQIISAYHISKEDQEGLRLSYQWFNDNYHSYCRSFKSVTGRDLELSKTSAETFHQIQKRLDTDDKKTGVKKASRKEERMLPPESHFT